MINLSALIHRYDYPAAPYARASFVATIYDKTKPRMPDNARPELHFEFVRTLGPFPTVAEAEQAALVAISTGEAA